MRFSLNKIKLTPDKDHRLNNNLENEWQLLWTNTSSATTARSATRSTMMNRNPMNLASTTKALIAIAALVTKECEDLTICGCADCLAEINRRVPDLGEHDMYRWSPDELGCKCNRCARLKITWKSNKNLDDHFINAWRRKPAQMRECGCFACLEILQNWAE